MLQRAPRWSSKFAPGQHVAPVGVRRGQRRAVRVGGARGLVGRGARGDAARVVVALVVVAVRVAVLDLGLELVLGVQAWRFRSILGVDERHAWSPFWRRHFGASAANFRASPSRFCLQPVPPTPPVFPCPRADRSPRTAAPRASRARREHPRSSAALRTSKSGARPRDRA